jgi:hypothetical protein
MESLFSLPLPFQRRLTKMYTDTKSSYDFVKEPVQSAEDPELMLLHRKLRIQKDRLVSWGLEWSDPSQSPDIDESINKAGLSELVGSVMSTIKEILAEAEPLWQSSKRSSDEKITVSEKSKTSLITWDKSRFEDLVRDLTMSIDTLYDLSRTRQSARKASALKASESSSSLQAKSPVLEERQFESTRMQTPQQIDPASIIWPRDLKSMQPGMLSPAQAPRQIVFMRRPTSLPDARKMGAQSLPTVPVLLEHAPYDPIYSITGITPSMTRFERLFAALSQAYTSSDRLLSGLLRLIGYFEEAEHSRFCLLYALPTHFGPVDIESPRMPSISILSDLLCSHSYEPSLEVKYRLAYNVANAVFDLHSKGVVHGNVVSSNILFIEHQSQTRNRMDLTQVNMRQSFLTSFDLFSDNATDSSEPTEISLYRHPLDPRITRYTRLTSDSKSLDLYGLAMLLLEVGLWTTIGEIFPHMPAIPENPVGVFKQLASRCGSLYMKAVQACWNAPVDELSQRTRPDVMHQKVFWKVSKALDACCAIDEASDDENESDDSPPIPSSPMKSSLPSTPMRRTLRDQKPPILPTMTSSPASDRKIDWSEKPLLQSYIKATSSMTEKTDWLEKPSSVKPSSMYQILSFEPHRLIVAAPVQQVPKTSKPKLRTYPAIRISQEHLDYWHTGLMPHINHVLRGFYKKYPESVEISLESIGESSSTTKPTILVICTSVNKVRSILKKSLVYDKSVFGLKVCRGKVVRSRKNGVKRSMASGSDVKPANGDHQERPSNGASIGAYVGERHLPPVSFGGLIMVDDKPYGMTVHHMLDDPSDGEDDLDTTAPILRSSAHFLDMPDLTHSESSFYSSGDEEFMYELSDYESDFSSDAGSETSDIESEYEEDSDDNELEPGDIKGIPQGCGEEYLITQPAIDDVDDDFYPSPETKDEDHLDSFQLGEVYASSGIRRRVENDVVHEIDWALFEFESHRCPDKNHIENGQRFCPVKGTYPLSVVPSSDLSDLQVHCMARTSGLQSGRILSGMVIVKIYGRQTPSSSYQVAGKLGVPGDSGAWVVDNEQGRACGHVLAWSSKKKVAYICPMDVLLRDVGETLNAKSISFPGGEEIYSPASTSSVTTQPAVQTSDEAEDELSSLMKELELPTTPSEIDGISPTDLGPESQDASPFIPIRLMTKTEDIKTVTIPRHQHLNFVNSARMEGNDGEGIGKERMDRVERVDRAVKTA